MSDLETMCDRIGEIERDKQYTVMSISKNDILEHYKDKEALNDVENMMEKLDDKNMGVLLSLASDDLYEEAFNCVINTVDKELLQ